MNPTLLLALTIFFEARGGPYVGKVMVASVIDNRVADSRWPATLTEVILQDRQFSCWNDKNPEDVDMDAVRSNPAWADCWEIARAGYLPSVPYNHYYNPAKVTPYWSKGIKRSVRVGSHRFCEL